MKRVLYSLLLLAAFSGGLKSADDKKKATLPPPPASPLDRYVAEAEARRGEALATTPGSIWIAGSRLADAARDVRASQTDDILTIVVAEQASAVTSGATTTARKSSTANSITSLLGIKSATGPLANLANVSGDTELAGTGTTTRSTTLNTILTARVTAVLPNGSLVVEASKDILINSEHQIISVRGVVRPADIDFTNSVQSIRLAQLELRVNGKGVVGDAIRRPNALYRFLLGILPF
jgi:flagellar L-ring protein precursor FlgH